MRPCQNRKWLSILYALFLCFLPSCASKESLKKTTLLLDWWANPNHVPIYVGLQKKIFQKHGIELEILNLQEPPSSLTYLLSSQVDVALYYMPLCMMGYVKAPHFKIIGKLHERSLYSFMTRKDSNINRLEDFHGRSLGVFGDSLSKVALHSLAKKGIQIGLLKTVQFEPVTLLYTKTLDIISGVYWNIEPFQLKEQNIDVQCFRWEDFELPDYPELVFIAHEEFLTKDPTFSKRFRLAIQESIDYCIEHPQDAFALYLHSHPEKKHLTWEQDAWEATCSVLSKTQEFDLSQLQIFYQWLEDCKILSREFNVKEILD